MRLVLTARRFGIAATLLTTMLASACGSADVDGRGSAEQPVARTAGALVRMNLSSQVAVLLDEIPEGPQREAAAAEALARDSSFWTERASRQVKLSYYKLVFRGLYYPSDWSSASKARGPLPLPPKPIWNVAISGKPRRSTNPQHDMVLVDYTFDSHILTGVNDPGDVEPNLATIGGVWDEAFSFPTDPDLLLERTGYACMDEDEYPPGSVFEENSSYFYDDACKAGGASGCHLTEFPKDSCVEALQKKTGIVKTAMRFTRIPFNAALADRVRIGTITNPNGADLAVVPSDMEDERRIVYRYFAPGACELEEGVISKLGWRRLLMFSATVQNNGGKMLHIGTIAGADSPWLKSNVFEFSACHGHYHFSHYGTFGYAGAPGSKRAFCLEDTNRFHNDESTTLRATHQSCNFQGVTAGWGDEYQFGLPGQWVDITDVDTTKPHALTFDSNPDRFLCEGAPVLDGAGNPIFDPTEFRTATGAVVSRQRCDMPSSWHGNNVGSVSVSSPGGSFVTEPCTRGQIGPSRNCGFAEQKTPLHACTPGSSVKLSCKSSGGPQVLRLCEKSDALGVGVACTLADSASNVIVGATSTEVTFVCPVVRDAAAGVGGYAAYQAPLLPSQPAASVTCTGW